MTTLKRLSVLVASNNMENLKTLKSRIEYCLKEYPDTRNSDTKLTSALWWKFYQEYLFKDEAGNLCVKLLSLYELPTQDDCASQNFRTCKSHKYCPGDIKNDIIELNYKTEADFSGEYKVRVRYIEKPGQDEFYMPYIEAGFSVI